MGPAIAVIRTYAAATGPSSLDSAKPMPSDAITIENHRGRSAQFRHVGGPWSIPILFTPTSRRQPFRVPTGQTAAAGTNAPGRSAGSIWDTEKEKNVAAKVPKWFDQGLYPRLDGPETASPTREHADRRRDLKALSEPPDHQREPQTRSAAATRWSLGRGVDSTSALRALRRRALPQPSPAPPLPSRPFP